MSNTDVVFAFFSFVLVCGLGGVLFLDDLQRKRAAERKAAEQARGPEQRIVAREPVEDGEMVRLQCGHKIHLIVYRVQSLNCKECASVPADGADPAHSASPEAKQ